MNAASRLVHHGVLTRQAILANLLPRKYFFIMLLIFSVLLSAFSIIYVTYTNRQLYASYQHQVVKQDMLHLQHSQLLLERGTWMVQSRIEAIAESKLDMVTPNHQSVVVIRE